MEIMSKQDTAWEDTISRLAVRQSYDMSDEKRVFLVDVNDASSPIESDGEHRWATVCDVHAGLVYHSTLDNARGALFFPEQWCPSCQELAEARVLKCACCDDRDALVYFSDSSLARRKYYCETCAKAISGYKYAHATASALARGHGED
ncbi:hypothetical protein UFOVP1305_79 [uncultured Caudovirales phage]|uniref:Uncharacterized protein n=1 Tax=uncultured Caudovirales phage TaxID=2100421 RepID=A0A6J5PEA1_9CAUD|nr:hypothetical protein UFOVP896_24 [uncultured Caudovirales phage]CAB4198388.1 hypothetical protein UFOVP1305_79 [uncultured Caudovirales phage]